MSILRPGGIELTRYALSAGQVKPGGALLDIGCGDGTAADLARREFHLDVTGIDVDENAVAQAKEKGVAAQVMDAAALEFPSRSFDVVMMECVFSVLERQEESIHEAYCVLRPGGVLLMSDLCCRHPDLARWRQEYREAMALLRRPREEGECEREEHVPSPYCQDGAVVPEGLRLLLDELEMEVILYEDRTEDLKTFAGQAILDYNCAEVRLEAGGGWAPCRCSGKNIGYFLLIARKKDA